MKLITSLGENTVPICTEIAASLRELVGIDIEFEPVPSSTVEAEPLFRGEVGLGWICGLLYIEKADFHNAPLDLLAAPIFSGSSQPDYYSHLIVPVESTYHSIDDLSGTRWAINEPGSWSGHHLFRAWLFERGLDLRYVGEIVESGAHSKSIRMIANCLADFATIDHGVFDYVAEREPDLMQKIRVIGQIGPSPSPPFVAHRSIPSETRVQIKQALLDLSGDRDFLARVAPHHLADFAAVDDHSYDPIRVGYRNSVSMM